MTNKKLAAPRLAAPRSVDDDFVGHSPSDHKPASQNGNDQGTPPVVVNDLYLLASNEAHCRKPSLDAVAAVHINNLNVPTLTHCD